MEQWLSATRSAMGCSVQSVQETKLEHAPVALDFRAVYARWFQRVAHWVRIMGGPAAERDDLVQDVFVVVHRRLPYFDGKNMAGWLYQIARRQVRDFRRLAWVRRIRCCSVPLDGSVLRDPQPSPAEFCETQQKRATLERLLATLTDAERTAVLLFEVDGYTGEQIAEMLNLRLNTVWSQIYKARRKLKAGLLKSEGKHLP